MSENYLRSYKEALFNLIARNVMSHPGLAEFDIAAHIVDNRFPDTTIEVTRSLIDQVDSQSDLFLHINASERGEIIRSTGIYVPSLNIYRDSLRKKLGRYSEPYFESSDRYRLAFVKTATLWFRECVNLNPDRAVGGKQKS